MNGGNGKIHVLGLIPKTATWLFLLKSQKTVTEPNKNREFSGNRNRNRNRGFWLFETVTETETVINKLLKTLTEP